MKLIRVVLSPMAVCAVALTVAACQQTAEGVKKDAAENAEKAEKAAADAAKAATEAGQAVASAAAEGAKEVGKAVADATSEAAKEAGKAVAEAAKEAAQKTAGAAGHKAAEASKSAGAAVAAAAQTFDVKASLMADTSIDAGKINVDTDPKTKTVILKGSVPTDQQKAAAEKLAISKAAGYKVVNQLVVVPENK